MDRDKCINIGHLCTSVQIERGLGKKEAVIFIGGEEGRSAYSFEDLDEMSGRAAEVLHAAGVSKGDVVCCILPKCIEVYAVFLGTLKYGSIICNLFYNMGGNALRDRLMDSGCTAVVTTCDYYSKNKDIFDEIAAIRKVLLVDSGEDMSDAAVSYRKIYDVCGIYEGERFVDAETPSVMHYTSGTTGRPKGVLHRHRAQFHIERTVREVLALEKDDIYWCTADHGWITGTSYGITGPLAAGVTQVQFAGPFNYKLWSEVLQSESVNVWYTAPTAIRMLMFVGGKKYEGYDFGRLRRIYSVGEPLNPEALDFAVNVFGCPVYDTWFQTETGGIMISNRPELEVKKGSMGKPVSSITASIMDDDGVECPAGTPGMLSIKTGWESMFADYLNSTDVYNCKFSGGWYKTGDKAYKDADGYFWFIGRDDDVINTHGHLVSPFEVESCILEIPDVAESAVIGVPDKLVYQRVVAYVVIKSADENDIARKIKIHVASRLSSIEVPQEVIITDELPKNRSGKIMRRVLRDEYVK